MNGEKKEKLNDLFGNINEDEKPKKTRSDKNKISKKEIKKQKKREEKMEKMEDESFLQMKEALNEVEELPELYLTNTNLEIEEKKQTKKETKKSSKKETKDFFSDNPDFTLRHVEVPKRKEIEKTRSIPKLKEETKEKSGFFNLLLDTIYGFFLIILLLASIAFVFIQISNKVDMKTIYTSFILVIGIVFYILSMLLKNKNLGKFFSILSSIALAIFMLLTLYLA